MRLKSLFVGGLSLLMLGLFPTVVWASEEGHPVEMSVAAVKQYYRDRDYVSLFDALVFAGGKYSRVMRPSEIYFSYRIDYFDQLRVLAPILSKIATIDLKYELPSISTKYVLGSKTSQQVIASGGVIIHTFGMSEKRFEADRSWALSKTLAIFPQAPNVADLLSSMFGELKLARKTVSSLMDDFGGGSRNWFSCSLMKVGHALDGTLHPLDGAPRHSIITAWASGGSFPHPNEVSICRLQGVMYGVGLRGSGNSNFKALFVDFDRQATIGLELQCVFNLLHHPRIIDGMDREKALSVLTALPKEDLHCE